jgi:hypothetical protein
LEQAKPVAAAGPTLREVRDHLVSAQDLMDSINPVSIFGARLQQLIDELEELLMSNSGGAGADRLPK